MQDKTLARIAALLRKAEATDNPHEAEAYLAAAQRIATATAIDLAVARAHSVTQEQRPTPVQREVMIGEPGRRGLRTYVELFIAIARANDVTCDIARNSTRVFAYGFDTDLGTCQALYASLIIQMVRASDEFISSGAYTAERVRRYSRSRRRWEIGPVSPITARISFQRAYAARIGVRLADARRQARKDAVGAPRSEHATRATSSSVALALRAKELELTDFYRAHSTARGAWHGSSASAGFSEHASTAGDRAARRARLGNQREIGGTPPGLEGR